MIRSHLNDLLRRKAVADNRKLPLRVVAEETKLSINTIQRLKRGSSGSVRFATLNKLCCYFDVDINGLIEYTPDKTNNPGAIDSKA